jgi:c(7)-type cytochrome triheme protein
MLVTCFVSGYVWSRGAYEGPTEVPTELDAPPLMEAQEKDYSHFTHTNQFHARMPCLLCHTRNTNASRMSFPGRAGHTPCAGCHVQQFSDNSSAICTICHTDPGSGAMKRFPGLRSFGRKFDHSRHRGVNCAVCHKASQRGVAFSIPSGANAHTTCFQCHLSNASSSMSSCNVCHQPGRLVRTSESARSFNMNFSHARHIRGSLNCANCHTVRPGAATGRQVTSPFPAMHFPPRGASCGACHNGTQVFGANNFANCRRCHLGNSFRF